MYDRELLLPKSRLFIQHRTTNAYSENIFNKTKCLPIIHCLLSKAFCSQLLANCLSLKFYQIVLKCSFSIITYFFKFNRTPGSTRQLSSNLQRNENASFAAQLGAFPFLHSPLHTKLQHFKKECIPE
jgi:hypothetical protein